MSQASPSQSAPTQTIPYCQAVIRGRIKASRRARRLDVQGVATVIALPAADQYSMPQTVEVWGADRLGEVGQEIAVRVQLGGYPRSYQAKREDPSGEIRAVTVQTADNTLTVIA